MPVSPFLLHVGDQFQLYSNKELRPVWFTYEEVEEHLEYREILSSEKEIGKYQ